jgi:hypothetical protein
MANTVEPNLTKETYPILAVTNEPLGMYIPSYISSCNERCGRPSGVDGFILILSLHAASKYFK